MSNPITRWFRNRLSSSDNKEQTQAPSTGEIAWVPKYKERQVRPKKSFKELAEAYESDGLLKESIDYQVDELVGPGFYVTWNSEYTLQLPRPGTEKKWTAIEAINKFNEDNNLDQWNQIIGRNLIAFGNNWIWVKDPLKPKIVPIKSVDKIDLKEGVLVQTGDYGSKKIPLSELIHMVWNLEPEGVLGQGVLLAMKATYKDAPDLIETRAIMKTQMVEAFKRFGSPNELWSIPGLADAKIKELNDRKDEMDSSGERIFVNREGKIVTVRSDRPTSFDAIIDSINSEFLLCTGNPLLRILGVPSLPPTVGETLKDLHDRRLHMLHQIMKRGIEELWRRVLKEYTFDPDEAHIRLNFGMEQLPEITIDNVFGAYDKQLISKEEARKMLKKYGKFELDTEQTQEEKE